MAPRAPSPAASDYYKASRTEHDLRRTIVDNLGKISSHAAFEVPSRAEFKNDSTSSSTSMEEYNQVFNSGDKSTTIDSYRPGNSGDKSTTIDSYRPGNSGDKSTTLIDSYRPGNSGNRSTTIDSYRPRNAVKERTDESFTGTGANIIDKYRPSYSSTVSNGRKFNIGKDEVIGRDCYKQPGPSAPAPASVYPEKRNKRKPGIEPVSTNNKRTKHKDIPIIDLTHSPSPELVEEQEQSVNPHQITTKVASFTSPDPSNVTYDPRGTSAARTNSVCQSHAGELTAERVHAALPTRFRHASDDGAPVAAVQIDDGEDLVIW